MEENEDKSISIDSGPELTHEEALALFDKNKGIAESFAKKYYKTRLLGV